MATSLEWLNSYLDRPADRTEAEDVLTDVGFPFDGAEVIEGTDDWQLDVEVTSNRPDCLCHLGLARELAAKTGRKLCPPSLELPEATGPDVNTLTSVTVEGDAAEACPLYTARVIRNVKVGPSPQWLARRLEVIGLRPVNNVVDITNYVLHELGQPLHAFDMKLLDGQRIVVRRATDGEAFTAIDGTKHKLRGDMLVIADASRPVAVAGVMGGLDSEVGNATTDILLESACFEPLGIRTTSRALKLSSDSSHRFERGVDPHGVDRASRRAAQLILELAGGELAEGVVVAGATPPETNLVSLRPDRAHRLMGVELPVENMVEYLAALGLSPEWDADADEITCTVPSHRLNDLRREVDLIEEVARMHGFDHIGFEPKMRITARRPQLSVAARKVVDRVLVARGYHETITFSFMSPAHAEPFRDGVTLARVDEEKKKQEPALRPSLLPSLLACRKSNQDAGNANVRLFEVAQVFGKVDGGYTDAAKLGMLADVDESKSDALRALRGSIEELLEAIGHTAEIVAMDKPPAWAEAAAQVVVDGKVLGTYGVAGASVLKEFKLQTPVVLAEFDYALLTAAYPPTAVVSDLPKFPAIERDLSIVVDEATRWNQIAAIVSDVAPARLEALAYVTTYRGKGIDKGRKSVTLRMTFRDPERTLQHDEVTEQVDAAVARFVKDLGAELRVN